MDARTEEIRARVEKAAKEIAEDAHCRYCDFQNQDPRLKCRRDIEFATKDIVKLVDAELTALREEVGRLKGALQTIADFAPGHGDVCEIIAKRARAALSPSPAQQETSKQD